MTSFPSSLSFGYVWAPDMISGATRGMGGAALARHLLSRKGGQVVDVLPARHLAGETLKDQIAELVAVSSHGRTSRPVHHVHVDPPIGSDASAVMDFFVTAYEAEFGLQDVPRCAVRHRKAGRDHFHVVWGLVREDGKVVDLSHDYPRREKVSRITEFACGLPMVPGKHNKAVHAALRKDGRNDVADAMMTAGLLDRRRPVAKATPKERAQAERTGIPVRQLRIQVLAAWRGSDEGYAFASILRKLGLRLAQGDRGVVVVDRAGSAHGLVRVLAAAARQDGDRITAAMVRTRIAGLDLLPLETERHDHDRESHAETHSQGPVPGAGSDPRGRAAPASPSRPSGRADGRERQPRPDHRPPLLDPHDPRPARPGPERDQGRRRTHWDDRIAVKALHRIEVEPIRRRAEAIRLRPIRRALQDREAALALGRIDVGSLFRRAKDLAAGGACAHAESREDTVREEIDMTSDRGILERHRGRTTDYKTRLLARIAPQGFDAAIWIEDLHMVDPGGPAGRSRVMTVDRGWIEIDRRAGSVFVWGPRGRAHMLATALAEAGGWTIEHLDGVKRMGRPAERGTRPLAGSNVAGGGVPWETFTETTVRWWRERGYEAISSADGVWIDAGATRIRDVGDALELHGPISDAAVLATVMKAREAWNGSMELYGAWTQDEMDRIWTECQRQGVEAHLCIPSKRAVEAWEREKTSATERSDTLARVRAAVKEVERLKDAAAGSPEDLNRLPPELRAFLVSYLDDDQRAELRAMPVDAIIPELSRFRALGREEVEEARRNGAPDPSAVVPVVPPVLPTGKPPAPAPRHAR